ncbi:MAG: hypothetical protein GY832_45220 [Chloroflexi bacterium]|nr:hypothetical protein [Chloroflexota bacterium]
MTDKIKELLESYHYKTLGEMAQVAGIQVTTGRKLLYKKDLLPKLQAEFFTEARIQASWEQLNEGEQVILNRLLLHSGPVATRSFKREIIRAGLATEATEQEKPEEPLYRYYTPGVAYDRGVYNGDPQRAQSLVFEDTVARLTYHGLVFSRGVAMNSGKQPFKIQFHPAQILHVPDFIRRYLPEPEPIPPRCSDWQPDQIDAGSPTLLLRDLYLYWDFVRRNEVSLIQNGLVAKRWLKAVNNALLRPDPLLKSAANERETGHLDMLCKLLETCGLIHRDRGMLRLTEQDAARIPDFWSRSQIEQASVCLESWARFDAIGKVPNAIAKYSPRLSHARQTLLSALKALPADTWSDPEELAEDIQIQEMNFLFPEHSEIERYRGHRYYSYSYGRYYGDTKSLLEKLERLEIEFVENCLTGFLYQVGAVELGYSEKRLRGLRLTSAGQVMLGLKTLEQQNKSTDQDKAGKLIIQPNFQLMAMGPISTAVLARLDMFAERERADLGVFEYRVSRDSVYQAQQLGIDVTKVIGFLEENCDTELPQNVRRSLDEWAAHHERIIFRTGVSLLQAADADLLATLIDDSRTGKHLARTVAPEVALLNSEQQKPLTLALIEQDTFPAVSDAHPKAADDSVIVQKDGNVRPIHAVPSLHLRERLSRLAKEIPGKEKNGCSRRHQWGRQVEARKKPSAC